MYEKPFFVESKGRWSVCPVSFKTLDEAIECARRFVPGAMRVTVYDCTEGPVGRVVACTSRGDFDQNT